MRLFQNCRYYPSLRPKIHELTRDKPTFAGKMDAFLKFRESAVHVLLPVEQRAEWAFFANGDDLEMQRVWAREHGMNAGGSAEEILKAQIEHHRTDVFYNLDVSGWSSEFIRTLPGCVKRVIGWHAVAFKNVSFAGYDLVVNNFPSIQQRMRETGCRTDYFFPAYDPEMDVYAARSDRPIDVLFVGGYSRHHQRRAAVLHAVAELAAEFNVVYHLDRSRLCALAESPLGRLLPLARHRRPAEIRALARAPIFGLDYYEVLSATKIVLNGAIDMAGLDRGNMRCFEAMGTGGLLLSDEGNYPAGMVDAETMVTYKSPEEAVTRIRELLATPARRTSLARAGHEMISSRYSKEIQWKRFEALVASI